MSLTYYLKIDGLTGDSTDQAHPGSEGWFQVDSFDIGATAPTSSGAGEAGGRAQFSPLSVDIHSLTGLAPLLADEVENKVLKSVELVGVKTAAKGASQMVYDLQLSNVQVTSLENDPGSQGVETQLAFSYKSGKLSDDVLGKTETASFTGSGSTAAVTPAATTTAPSTSPLHYYLKIDGLTGDSTDQAHPGSEGWFQVESFDIGGDGYAGRPAARARRGGRAQFSPLSVDIHSLTGLAPLLADEVENKVLKSVELVGVKTAAKGASQMVYDLQLSNVQVTSLENDPGSQGVETQLAFSYKSGKLSDDVLGKTETASFTGSGSTAAVTPAATTTAPSTSPLHYYLKIDGLTGDSTDQAHPGSEGWFQVDSFDIGATAPTSSGAGEAGGRAQFSPLSVDIHSLTGLAPLLADEVENKVLKSVELVGVKTAAKGASQMVYDLQLSNVQVTSLGRERSRLPGCGDAAGVQLQERQAERRCPRQDRDGVLHGQRVDGGGHASRDDDELALDEPAALLPED